MNDQFLHALRREPPPQFARELKRRLDRQARQRVRASIARTILGMVLIGGIAMAALLLRERPERSGVAASVTHTVARSPFAPSVPSAASSNANSVEVPQNSTPSQPEATESVGGDIPVAFITSPLPRPLAQALVGRLTQYGYFAQPRLTSMEDDEALRTLCAGNTDFVMVSRSIAREERALCDKWGIGIMEWKLGYQAVVLAAGPAAKPLSLTPRDVFLALAERIPDPARPQRLIDNPNVTWHDVDARFDDREIEVANSASIVAFLQLAVEPGCESFPWIRSLKSTDRPRYEDICRRLRTDDRYRSFDLDLVRYWLRSEASRIVVLDYQAYAAKSATRELPLAQRLPVTMLDGPAPTLATMTDGTYPAARPVYVYAQRSHLDWNRAARKLADDLTDPDAVGPEGYLVRLGLVPVALRESRQP
ncbi:MAG TPA: substrate-binding domain-containing protein [Steroidobacteraceae bacterium]|jgi:phosphate transport system substrate-binding protein